MTLRIALIVLTAFMVSACKQQAVSGVHGWSGPQTTVHVDRSGAEITLLCPTEGWRMTIDRVTRSNDTASLYLTAHRPTDIVAQRITPIHLHWAVKSGLAPTCVEAMIRIDDGRWLPAAEGCR